MMFLTQASNRETIRRYALLSLLSAVLGVLFLLYMSYSQVGRFPSLRHQFDRYALAVSITLVCSLSVYQVDRFLDRFIHWRANFLIRFLSGFVLNVAVAILIVTGSAIYFFKTAPEEILKLCILFTISIFIYEIFYG